jgi:hypothetical protein
MYGHWRCTFLGVSSGIVHAQRFQNILLDVRVQWHSGYSFDHKAEPVNADAIFVSRAWIEGKGSLEVLHRAYAHIFRLPLSHVISPLRGFVVEKVV